MNGKTCKGHVLARRDGVSDIEACGLQCGAYNPGIGKRGELPGKCKFFSFQVN